MGVALETGADLVAVLACIVALAALFLVKGGAQALADALRHIPLIGRFTGDLANLIENHIVTWLSNSIRSLEKTVVGLLSGMVDSLAILIAIPLLLYLGTKTLGQYIWAHTWHGDIGDATKNVRAAAAEALATAKEASKLAHGLAASFNTRVVETIEGYLHRSLGGTTTELGIALHALENSAKAANAAASAAETTAATALTTAADAAKNAVTNVTENIVREVTTTVEETFPGLTAALGAIEAELPAIPGVSLPDLENLLNGQDLATLGGLLAAIPLIRAITTTIAAESGLENADCRRKIKGVCATDPNVWANLIGGLALFGLPFSLREIVEVARPMVGELSGAIEEVAQ